MYGIDYQQLRLYLLDVAEYVFERCFGDDVAVVAHAAYAVGAEFDLHCAFFAGNVEYATRFYGEDILKHKC